jgi:hypothetical protein
MLMSSVVQDPHQVTKSGAVAQEPPGKRIDGQNRAGETGKSHVGMLRLVAMFGTGAAQVHAATADASLGKTPQHQAWDILQAGLSDKSARRRTKVVLALGLLPRGSEGLGHGGGGLSHRFLEILHPDVLHYEDEGRNQSRRKPDRGRTHRWVSKRMKTWAPFLLLIG